MDPRTRPAQFVGVLLLVVTGLACSREPDVLPRPAAPAPPQPASAPRAPLAKEEPSVPRIEPVKIEPPKGQRAEDGCRLTGLLLDQDGHAFDGLELELRPCEAAHERARWGDVLAGLSDGASFATIAGGSDGSFAFAGVPPGGWGLSVRGAPEVPRATFLFRIGAERARHMQLALARGLYLRGVVLDPEGEPRAGAQIAATGFEASYHERAPSKADGTFALGPLPESRYRLEASSGESLSAASVVGIGEFVVLRLAPGGVLLVRASDEHGAPLDVELTLQGATLRNAVGSEMRLAHLPHGAYEVIARAPEGRIAVVQDVWMEPGLVPVPLSVVVRRGCELRLRLLGNERRAWRAEWNGTRIDSGTLDPGGEARLFLPPGPVRVWWASGTDELALEHLDERVLAPSEDPSVIEYQAPP